MPSKRITLLDRAKADLFTAKTMLATAPDDDVVVDVCAYHCQQCVEKTVKFLILLQGESYAPDHRSHVYLEELKDEEMKSMVEQIGLRIDAWATTIRYHHTILSNRQAVSEIIGVCEKLIAMATHALPLGEE
ncbi:MAG: HEPN domain-containing protein [Defluviitaleaceae bacterium]|nr:HEPN domain-containing protein [Defluviitaleaceae bacterium]MCL2239075.1 HEPN domain-containing protein [Defluviitaleaceae bacterium]